ncbi:hypothetical protein MTO96_025400 [Rhipicephalus appendiculatus]
MDPSSSKEPPPDKPKKLQRVTIADTPKPAPKSNVKIRGFSDLAGRKKGSEDEGQAFYAGGSESSGQQIIGPGKKPDSKEDFVADMFRAARIHGATIMEPGSG